MESAIQSTPPNSEADRDRQSRAGLVDPASRQNSVTISAPDMSVSTSATDIDQDDGNRPRASFATQMTMSQMEKLVKENKTLKGRIDQIEKENTALKKSLFDISAQYSAYEMNESSQRFIFDLPNALKRESPKEEYKDSKANNGTKTYGFKHDLKGHLGAVYVVQFSPCSKFIASGSMDKTLKIWEVASSQKETISMQGHALNIMDVHWSNDSSRLLSGSYDQTSRLWDIVTARQIYMAGCDGFVQAIMFNPADNNIFMSGTSRNRLIVTDSRRQSNVLSIENDSMINSIFIYRDGIHVLTGDSHGYLKIWDTRTGQSVARIQNGKGDPKTLKAISNISVSRPFNFGSDTDSRYMAVTSYDNTLRFYDRGFEPLKTTPRPLYTAKGHKNRNFPIRNSIYQGREYIGDFNRTKSSFPEEAVQSTIKENDKSPTETTTEPLGLEHSMIAAVGSIDSSVYLYDMSGPEITGQPMQILEGHTDKVFGVSFSTDATLASCSADGLIKIWTPLPAKVSRSARDIE